MMLSFYMLNVAAQTEQPDPDSPSLELLEFLGEWETEQGEWIDPTHMLDQPEADASAEKP